MITKISVPAMAAFLLLLAACGSDKPAEEDRSAKLGTSPPLNVQLICETVSESEEDPRSAVYALIDESKVKLADIAACETIPADQFGQYQIPTDAVAAVGGWWAGFGDYVYARRQGETIELFIGEMGESEEETGVQYRRIAVFSEGQFRFDEEVR
ncbi:MAG: hypothetical protein HUU34_03870 [Saprospiraceae bacterium]|jgi:hypothetical protein|nr:hypothetical protein [Saprospiraceae bacterium]